VLTQSFELAVNRLALVIRQKLTKASRSIFYLPLSKIENSLDSQQGTSGMTNLKNISSEKAFLLYYHYPKANGSSIKNFEDDELKKQLTYSTL